MSSTPKPELIAQLKDLGISERSAAYALAVSRVWVGYLEHG